TGILRWVSTTGNDVLSHVASLVRSIVEETGGASHLVGVLVLAGVVEVVASCGVLAIGLASAELLRVLDRNGSDGDDGGDVSHGKRSDGRDDRLGKLSTGDDVLSDVTSLVGGIVVETGGARHLKGVSILARVVESGTSNGVLALGLANAEVVRVLDGDRGDGNSGSISHRYGSNGRLTRM
ncbi:hypothetical protein PFISCL1PPCAC_23984, partial [Pristionchus fissidentatus]